MKLETKKISLILATALWIFSGIFLLPQAAGQEQDVCFAREQQYTKFEKITITNKIDLDIKVQLRKADIESNAWGKLELGTFISKHGEILEASLEDDLSSLIKLSIYPIDADLTFDCFNTYDYLQIGRPTLLRCTAMKGLEVLGDIRVVALLDDKKTLNIAIGSKDGGLTYSNYIWLPPQ